jgi:hypothetical protein
VSRIACGANAAGVLFCGTHRRFPENDRDESFAELSFHAAARIETKLRRKESRRHFVP